MTKLLHVSAALSLLFFTSASFAMEAEEDAEIRFERALALEYRNPQENRKLLYALYKEGHLPAMLIVQPKQGDFSGCYKLPDIVQMYEPAVAQGCPKAQYKLAYMYQLLSSNAYMFQLLSSNDESRRKAGKFKAACLYKLALDQGYFDAAFHIGDLYLDFANDISKFNAQDDPITACIGCYQQDQSDIGRQLSTMYTQAARTLAFEDPMAVRFQFYKIAADHGHPQAQCVLGILYWHGSGVSEDCVEALRYYQLAVNQGNRDAQGQLSYLLQTRLQAEDSAD